MVNRFRIVVVALLLAVISVGFALPADGEHPPHVERPTAGVSGVEANALAAAWGEAAAQAAWIEGVNREAWVRGVEEAEAFERSRRVVVSTPVGGGVGGDCAALSAQLGLSEAILWRESRCTWVDNMSNCSGRGCLGPAQVDTGHFSEVSPWDSGTSGVCFGLDPNSQTDYAECVSRLPGSAWNG